MTQFPNTKGQKTMAESDPVVLPSDQILSVDSNGAYLATELTSLSILSTLQQQSDYEAKLVVDSLNITYLEIRIWNSSTETFSPPIYYLPNSNVTSTPTPPLSYINPNTFLSLIVSNTTGVNLEDTQKLVLTAVTNTQTILTNINNKLVNGTDIGDVTINNTGGGSAVNIQDGGNVISIDDAGGSLTVDGTVSLSTATLNALESITVQNGAGASAVNIQDGGNSITVDGTITANAGTGNFNVVQSTASNLNVTVGNTSGSTAVNIQDGGNSITVDGGVGFQRIPNFLRVSGATGTTPSDVYSIYIKSVGSSNATVGGILLKPGEFIDLVGGGINNTLGPILYDTTEINSELLITYLT
jgi:hypothetical protein